MNKRSIFDKYRLRQNLKNFPKFLTYDYKKLLLEFLLEDFQLNYLFLVPPEKDRNVLEKIKSANSNFGAPFFIENKEKITIFGFWEADPLFFLIDDDSVYYINHEANNFEPILIAQNFNQFFQAIEIIDKENDVSTAKNSLFQIELTNHLHNDFWKYFLETRYD